MTPNNDSGLTRWQTLQRELGKRFAERLFNDLSRDPSALAASAPAKVSLSLVFAFMCATIIYAVSVGFGVAGVMILTSPWSNLFVVLFGVVLVLLCWIALPRPVTPPDYPIVESQYPTLYSLTRRIADKMSAPHVAAIAISADFGANYRTAGWRMHRYIELGAPLLAMLSPQERVAVIAHELSHGANGDPLRGQFLFGAVSTLANWAVSLRPSSIGNSGDRMELGPLVSLVGIPFELMMLGVSETLFLATRGILLLVLRQSQRAEYLADRLAATVSGTLAMQSALEKTYLAQVVDTAVHRHVIAKRDDPLEPTLQEARASVSEQDIHRFREQSTAESWQVDSTHPPTALRTAMLALGTPLPAMELLTPAEQALLDTEFASLIASQQREIINRKVEEIYGG